MLSLDYPEIMTFLSTAGPGLWPIRTEDDELALAVKGSSDLAFAVKHRRSLKFHFYRLEVGSACTIGIITAIYDRQNAPIAIQTVCVNDLMRRTMAEVAAKQSIGIYFFDSHNSELAGGTWKLETRADLRELFQTCNSEVPMESRVEFYVALKQRFSNPNDDGLVIEATLFEENRPENLSVIHVTQEAIRSRRGEGYGIYQSTLSEDKSPGAAHEAEIARLLAKVYPMANIVVGPEISKGKEFCDVLAIGNHEATAVHAKSAVRDEKRFDEDIKRRDARIDKHFRKAIAQARGAERAFYTLKRTITFEGERLALTPETKLLIHVIVLHDKPPNLFENWSAELAQFASELTPVVVLDMAEMVNLLNCSKDREFFVAALMTLAKAFQRRKLIGEYTFGRDRVAIH
jgi:hypothetical protein